MTLTLPPELQRWVEDQVSAGRFASADDLLGAGVRLLRDREDDLRRAISLGVEQADRGQVGPLSAEDTLARVRAARTAEAGG